jgi:hypothetical protein
MKPEIELFTFAETDKEAETVSIFGATPAGATSAAGWGTGDSESLRLCPAQITAGEKIGGRPDTIACSSRSSRSCPQNGSPRQA